MSEVAKTNGRGGYERISFVWLGFFALVIVFYFFGLTIPLVGPDEPRYAEVAREMLQRGDWVTPTLGGFAWFEKPALLYWLEICSYKLFGISEFAARFGSALFGLGTIASLCILGKRWSESSQDDCLPSPANSASWLALMAASTLGIVAFSRGASFDIIVTFPVTASLVSFFIWDLRVRNGPRSEARTRFPSWVSLFLFYFFIGIALLAKGLIGIVFPIGIVAFYFLLSMRWPGRGFVISLFWGTLVSLAVASVWYLPVILSHGYSFIDEFIIQQHFQRFTTNKYQHPQPFYFFLWVLPLMVLPWMPFFLAGVWKSVEAIFRRPNAATGDAEPGQGPSIHRFAIAWLLVPLVFFSFSGSKLPGYILPAVPAAVLFAWLFLLPRVHRSSRWRLAVASVGSFTILVSVILLATVVPRYADADSVKRLIAAAAAQGHGDERVMCLNTLSHNAEFYAAGRLVRDAAGRQRRFYAPAEIRAEIETRGDSQALVLVPVENESLLTRNETLDSRILSDNGDLAIVLVKLK